MVDILALVVSHGLLALAVLRLLMRGDLYDESPAAREREAEQPGRRTTPVVRPGVRNERDA